MWVWSPALKVEGVSSEVVDQPAAFLITAARTPNQEPLRRTNGFYVQSQHEFRDQQKKLHEHTQHSLNLTARSYE